MKNRTRENKRITNKREKEIEIKTNKNKRPY